MSSTAAIRFARHSAALMAVVSVTAACGDEASTVAGSAQADPDRVEIVTHDDEAGMEALGTFVLEYDAEHNCLFHLEADNNGEPGTGGRVIVIWREGHTAERSGDDVVVVDETGEEVARTGVPVTLAGGGGATELDHCGAVGAWSVNPG